MAGEREVLSDVEKLQQAIVRDFPTIQPWSDPAWSRSPAARVIDCVLSLNRRYDGFVVPRLEAFEREFPHLTIRQLRALIDSHRSPGEFSNAVLDYNHRQRAETLSGVVDYLLASVIRKPSEPELPQLERWATSARPDDVKRVAVRGFGLAGFQYLRMLFGANTTKPDVHIIGYLAEAVERGVTAMEALRLLDGVAKALSVSLRDLDGEIWRKRARGDAPRAVTSHCGSAKRHTNPSKAALGNQTSAQPNSRHRSPADLNARDREHYEVAESFSDEFGTDDFKVRYAAKYPSRAPGSMIPSDYCFNIENKGNHLYPRFLTCVKRGRFAFVGLKGTR